MARFAYRLALVSALPTAPIFFRVRLMISRFRPLFRVARPLVRTMSSDADAVKASIAALNEHIHGLRSQSADQATIAAEMKKLGELKKQLGQLSAGAKDDSKKSRLVLKTPKVCLINLLFPDPYCFD